MSLGSIEGGGLISLGSRNLAVGGNNLSTEFSGRLRDGGFVNATGGSLAKVGTGTLTGGLERVIIDNTSGTPTVGKFAGLAEGASFSVGRNILSISYVGGDGNDVAITALGSAPELELTLSDLEVTSDGIARTFRGKISGGTAAAGRDIRIEGSADLQVWVPMGSFIADATGTVAFEIVKPIETRAFFLRTRLP